MVSKCDKQFHGNRTVFVVYSTHSSCSDNNRLGNFKGLTDKWVHCVQHDSKNTVVH